MIDRALLARVRIEPLDRNKHDRAAFSCGSSRVDNFLQKSAGGQQDNEITRVYVACLDNENDVIGFYALNSHGIDVSTIPDAMHKKLPSYPTVPSIYLSVFGVHTVHQGRGVGKFIMADAFKKAAAAADLVGSHLIVLDALDADAARFYRGLKFIDLPGYPPENPRMIISMRVVRAAIAAASKVATSA